MVEVIMPKMGDGMEEGQLVEWVKKEGQTVKSGEVIGTIQTDKATLELESPGTGTLAGFLIKEGAAVPVGTPIAAILADGETLPADWGTPKEKRVSAPAEAPVAPSSVKEPVKVEVANGAPEPEAVRIKASPLARKMAQDADIDIATIAGSGPGGRIVERDVRDAISKQGTRVVVTPVGAIAETGEDKKVPLNRLRQITAERTHQSKSEAPHFYVTVEVDVDKIMALREFFTEEEAGKLSINDFVIMASARALQDMPEVNATYRGDHILRFGAVHIGVAAAVDEGLLVPVIRNAHLMTLRQAAQKSKELVARAREGKLTPDEMSGSTFSISNMGMLNVDTFAAIINIPNAAIVAVSSAKKKAVVGDDDEIEIRWRMNLTGSFDHRVVDGAIGAKFMNALKGYLENPTRLLN